MRWSGKRDMNPTAMPDFLQAGHQVRQHCFHSLGCAVVASFLSRPVPLEHFLFPAGGDGLHLVVDNKGRFRQNNFQVRYAACISGLAGHP